jgi:DsbC/DsbD-like thiol-disulfide interchange protein
MKFSLGDMVLTFLLLLGYCFAGHAQRPTDVVKWSAESTKPSSSAPSVTLSATIQDGWHVYALSQPAGGPSPLKISIPAGSPFALASPVADTKVVRHFDQNFNMETVYYLKTASFNLALKGPEKATTETLSIEVRFQACSDRLCLPPYTTHLSAALKGK